MKYYLGIDGGGTLTSAVVADENGRIISRASSETLNFYSVDMAVCRKNLENILTKILVSCGIHSFYATVIGCSALDGPASQSITAALCGGILDSQKIYMDSDAFVALKAATGNCVAICGTGSMAIGEKINGEIVTKGGWGHIIGDEGSAYSIAVCALKLCCQFSDKGISHPLLEKAKEYFGVQDFRKAIDFIYSPVTSKAQIAGFASQVDLLANNGCVEATQIIKTEAVKYSQTVSSLIKAVGGCKSLSLYGGVFENSVLFKQEFSRQIHNEYAHTNITMLTTPPEEGALKVAMKL